MLNGTPVDDSVDLADSWVAVAADRINKKNFTQTGPTRQDAIDSAINLCNIRLGYDNGHTCVFVRAYRIALLPRYLGEPIGSQYACYATETNNPTVMHNRSWIGVAKKEPEARKAAMDKCTEKAGIECRISRCSTADGNKIPL